MVAVLVEAPTIGSVGLNGRKKEVLMLRVKEMKGWIMVLQY